jgi:DNA-binding NarL/FixJ family response regulator
VLVCVPEAPPVAYTERLGLILGAMATGFVRHVDESLATAGETFLRTLAEEQEQVVAALDRIQTHWLAAWRANLPHALHVPLAKSGRASMNAPSTTGAPLPMPELGGAPEAAQLSPREREVLALAALGYSNASIARTCCITVKTVENHVTSVLAKLGVHSRAAAVASAWHLGLVKEVAVESDDGA